MADTSYYGSMPVASLAADTVARISPEATVQELAEALVDSGVGALVVGEGAAVEGIVSERDVVRALAAGSAGRSRAIDLATTSVVRCDVTASVAEVARVMMDHYVRHVLLEDGGRLSGIVSARDLLGAYVAPEPDFSTDAW